MSSTITFPPLAPALKLASRIGANPPSEKWAATLTEERRRLLEDQEALRERETNLRAYEDRLRSLQAEIEAARGATPIVTTSRSSVPFIRPSSKAPFTDDGALQAAWEKLHRSRELFEAEQAHLRDERIILGDQQNEVKRRDEAVALREMNVALREHLIAAAERSPVAREPVASEHTLSAMTRVTRAPFEMARSVFRGKK